MAFRSNGPTMLALPPFRGFTRKLILAALAAFFGVLVLGLVSPQAALTTLGWTDLQPRLLFPQVWRLVTYSFAPSDLLSTLFSLLSIWFFGSALEDERGSNWLAEFFFSSTIGGGLLASLLVLAVGRHVAGFDPEFGIAAFSMWPAVMAVMVAYAVFFAEQEILLMFVLRVKAKYVAAIYLLFYLALALRSGDRFGALTVLCVAAAGYMYLRLAPRQGLRFAGSETWFGWRNAYYRAKRRRAAKKFTVYMRKQGKDTNIDPSGRYVDPGGEPRDPNDKRWMN